MLYSSMNNAKYETIDLSWKTLSDILKMDIIPDRLHIVSKCCYKELRLILDICGTNSNLCSITFLCTNFLFSQNALL